MASLQMTKQASLHDHKQQQKTQNLNVPATSVTHAGTNGIAVKSEELGSCNLPEKRPMQVEDTEANWVVKKVQVENNQQYFKPLEDHHIEQMIEELLHYGSIELCSALPQQSL